MLKKMLVFLAVVFLMAETALATNFTILDVSPGVNYVGQVNLQINQLTTWGYCVEKTANSYIGVPYSGELRELPDNMLVSAGILYQYYGTGDVLNTPQPYLDEGRFTQNTFAKAVQETIWNAIQYASTPTQMWGQAGLPLDADGLRVIFKWADIPNVNGWGQDYIVRVSPVPEPATMLLMGIGLLGIAANARKRFR